MGKGACTETWEYAAVRRKGTKAQRRKGIKAEWSFEVNLLLFGY